MNKLHKRMKSIKHYINNKEEMINQVFSCVSEKQIKKMTPPVLKDMSIDELKAECLVQLLTMSNSAIIDILDGRKNLKTDIKNSENHRKASQDKDDDSKEKNRVKTDDRNNEELSDSTSTKAVKRKQKEKKHKSRKKRKRSDNDDDNEQTDEKKTDDESKGKNLLELLELEMRAKAIRSLLKKEEEREKQEVENQEKPVVSKELQKVPVNKNITRKDRKIKENFKNKICDNGRIKLQLPISTTWPKYSHTKTDVKTQRSNIIEEIKAEKNITEAVDCSVKEQKNDNYDWSMDEEKLIYEDEDDESDLDKDKRNIDISRDDKCDENTAKSWAERWLQSKEVKKVVATSKMLTVVRNKMKNSSKSKSKTPSDETESKRPHLELQGSVREYDNLAALSEDVMRNRGNKQ